MIRAITDDERYLMNHITRWGSDGYPVQKVGSRWTWGNFLSIQGPPIMFKTKREAFASFEEYMDLLRFMLGQEAYESTAGRNGR